MSWARTNPLPKMTPDDARRLVGRFGRRAHWHLWFLRRPIPIARYPKDDTLRRLVRRGLVLVIPYKGVDMLVNHGAVNAMLAGRLTPTANPNKDTR